MKRGCPKFLPKRVAPVCGSPPPGAAGALTVGFPSKMADWFALPVGPKKGDPQVTGAKGSIYLFFFCCCQFISEVIQADWGFRWFRGSSLPHRSFFQPPNTVSRSFFFSRTFHEPGAHPLRSKGAAPFPSLLPNPLLPCKPQLFWSNDFNIILVPPSSCLSRRV